MRVITGDLIQLALQERFDVIVHGCNCFNTMGAGIAKQLAMRWPQVAEVDRTTNMADKAKLGTFTVAETPCCKVVNAYTQYHYGHSNGAPFDYQAFEEVLHKIGKHFPKDTKFGFPMIGCGLAGGDPVKVMRILTEWAIDRDVVLVRLDQ